MPSQLPLSTVKNIGAVTAGRLNQVGLRTLEQLEALGPVEAYRRVKAKFPRETTLVCLYALQGAIWDVHWKDLPPEIKAELKAQTAV